MAEELSQATNAPRSGWVSALPAGIPYVAVGVGLFVLHNAWALGVIYYCGVVGCVALAWRRKPVKSLLEGFNWAGVWLSLLVAAVIFVAIVARWSAAVRDGFDMPATLKSLGLGGPALVVFIVAALVVNPPMEELLWRRILYVNTNRPVLFDLAFAGFHVPILRLAVDWPHAVAAALGLCLFSWLVRWSCGRFGGLAVPWMVHFAADAAIVAALIVCCRCG